MYDAASSDFSQALQLDPEYLVTYYYRGRMKIMYTQDKQGGCDDLKKAYNDPNDRDGEIARSIVDLRQSFCTNFP
jgi:lipoprotein NlpI